MPLKLTETNLSIKHTCRRLKIPYWRGTDQLAIYKYDRGVELVVSAVQDLNTRPQDFKGDLTCIFAGYYGFN